MEQFLIYIGKASIAAGAFYIAFLLLFQNRKQFSFNRVYLPVSFLLSFIIPLITFTTVNYIEVTPTPVDNSGFNFYVPLSAEPLPTPQFTWEWYHYLFGIFIIGLAGFLLNLLLGHLKAILIIRKSNVVQLFKSAVNLTKRDVHPFSFFNKIVLSEKTINSPNLEIIVEHEKVHVKEKHTFDILISEILFLFQWFNPFAWLLKDAVKNNLEFKTDHEIAKRFNPQTYQLAMVALADKKGVAPFLTALNGSQLKNRIIMMKKKTENKYSFLKQLVILPLLAVLVMGLSNKEVKTEFVEPETQNLINKDVKDLKTNKFLISIQFDQEKEIVRLRGINGCAFNELTYTVPDNKAVKINQFGLNSQMDNDRITANSNLADFQFSIVRENEMFRLTGKNGTNWKELQFSATDKGHFINETGVFFQNPEKERIISGKVTDKNGVPIKGASVVVKGRQYGVVTDRKGNYEIETNEEDYTLIFAYLDIDKKEINIDNQSKIDIQLDKNKNVESRRDENIKGSLRDGSFQMMNSKGEWGKPLILVNGEEVDNLDGFFPRELHLLNFLNEDLAKKYYGSRAEYGAVQIGTKDWKFPSGSNPLIIVDGEEYSGKISEIPRDEIFQVNELRYPNLTEKYGARGKDGVVEIKTNKMKPVGALKGDKEKKSDSFYSFGEKTDLNSLIEIHNENKSKQIPGFSSNQKEHSNWLSISLKPRDSSHIQKFRLR